MHDENQNGVLFQAWQKQNCASTTSSPEIWFVFLMKKVALGRSLAELSELALDSVEQAAYV